VPAPEQTEAFQIREHPGQGGEWVVWGKQAAHGEVAHVHGEVRGVQAHGLGEGWEYPFRFSESGTVSGGNTLEATFAGRKVLTTPTKCAEMA
jgi:hypothetical protein